MLVNLAVVNTLIILGEIVRLHLDMITRSEYEIQLTNRLKDLEAHCYTECRELMHALEDRFVSQLVD